MMALVLEDSASPHHLLNSTSHRRSFASQISSSQPWVPTRFTLGITVAWVHPEMDR